MIIVWPRLLGLGAVGMIWGVPRTAGGWAILARVCRFID
jgi:hypothetical protein